MKSSARHGPPLLIVRVTPTERGWEARLIDPDAPAVGACGDTAGQALDAVLALAGHGTGSVSVVADVPG